MASELIIKTDAGIVDLYQNAERDFYVTRQIHDLHNFQTRNADFSKNLSIPPTSNNIVILSLADEYQGEQGIPCNIILGGLTISPSALMYYVSTETVNEVDSIKIVIFYGNFNFFNSIRSGDISQINWADLAINWEIADLVTASQNTTDLTYPIANWSVLGTTGYVANQSQQDINLTGFFVYAKEIIKRIIEEAGYAVVLDASVPADYSVVAIACPMDAFFGVTDTGQVPLSSLVINTLDQSVLEGITETAIFQNDAGDNPNWWSLINNEFTVGTAGDYTVTLTGIYTHDHDNNATDSFVRILVNNVTVATFISDTDEQIPTNFFMRVEVSALVGDLIRAEIETGVAPGGNVDIFTLVTGSEFKVTNPAGDTSRLVQPSLYVPQVERKSFLTGILNMFNLVLLTDDVARIVTIKSFNTIYTQEEQNLTSILDVGGKVTRLAGLDSLGRDSLFTWELDNILRNDANLTIRYDNDILSPSKVVISLPFSACDNGVNFFVGSFDTFPKVTIPMINGTIDNYPAPDSPVYEEINIATGVFKLDKEIDFNIGDWFSGQPAGSWYRVIAKVDDLNGTLQPPLDAQMIVGGAVRSVKRFAAESLAPRLAIIHIDGGEANHWLTNGFTETRTSLTANSQTATWFDRLTWTSLATDYYEDLLSAFITPMVIKATFNLSPLRFVAMDFLRPVYIEQYNAFFYINKIEQFKYGEKTRMELIRISRFEESIS